MAVLLLAVNAPGMALTIVLFFRTVFRDGVPLSIFNRK
jgi:hypothetical protein